MKKCALLTKILISIVVVASIVGLACIRCAYAADLVTIECPGIEEDMSLYMRNINLTSGWYLYGPYDGTNEPYPPPDWEDHRTSTVFTVGVECFARPHSAICRYIHRYVL